MNKRDFDTEHEINALISYAYETCDLLDTMAADDYDYETVKLFRWLLDQIKDKFHVVLKENFYMNNDPMGCGWSEKMYDSFENDILGIWCNFKEDFVKCKDCDKCMIWNGDDSN